MCDDFAVRVRRDAVAAAQRRFRAENAQDAFDAPKALLRLFAIISARCAAKRRCRSAKSVAPSDQFALSDRALCNDCAFVRRARASSDTLSRAAPQSFRVVRSMLLLRVAQCVASARARACARTRSADASGFARENCADIFANNSANSFDAAIELG